MSDYIIGLDLGTSQTKICSRHTNTQVDSAHAFILHKFSSTKDYLLPSTISLDENGRIKYGILDDSAIINFKMKALYPDIPLYKIDDDIVLTDGVFDKNKLESLPEISVVLYLAYCILDVKESFKTITKIKNLNIKKAHPLDRLQNKEARQEPKHNYRITLGIPTKFDYNDNEHERRNKQYEMLFIANLLADEFLDVSTYTSCVIGELIQKIKTLIGNYCKEVRSVKFYHSKGLYVVAETTAGVYFTLNQIGIARRNLEEGSIETFKDNNYGYYISFDVGAGTTDVSFFRIYEDIQIPGCVSVIMQYYAAESITIASNDLHKYYSKNTKISRYTLDLKNYINHQDQLWFDTQIHIKDKIYDAIRTENAGLVSRVRRAFQGNFRNSWDIYESGGKAKGIKVFGGGSAFSAFSGGEFILDYGGVNQYIDHLLTRSQCSPLFQNNEIFQSLYFCKPDLNLMEPNEIPVEILPILNLCIGLTMIDDVNRPDGLIQMNKDSHPKIKESVLTKIQIQNDNTGVHQDETIKSLMQRFDFFNRDWI